MCTTIPSLSVDHWLLAVGSGPLPDATVQQRCCWYWAVCCSSCLWIVGTLHQWSKVSNRHWFTTRRKVYTQLWVQLHHKAGHHLPLALVLLLLKQLLLRVEQTNCTVLSSLPMYQCRYLHLIASRWLYNQKELSRLLTFRMSSYLFSRSQNITGIDSLISWWHGYRHSTQHRYVFDMWVGEKCNWLSVWS